jgi:hypothetical protein
MKLQLDNTIIDFEEVELEFFERGINSVFRFKNNKSLQETLEGNRYGRIKLNENISTHDNMKKPLGEFLYELKSEGRKEYLEFLNRYGDSEYCQFKIKDSLKDNGIYLWVSENQIKYVGRCTDNFGKRVNSGYGKISAKNCFIDGQATNCHLNSLINNSDTVKFFVYKMTDKSKEEIHELEKRILSTYDFEWNIQKN